MVTRCWAAGVQNMMELKSMLELSRQAVALISGAPLASQAGDFENGLGSTSLGTLPRSEVAIHIASKMPETKGTIGFCYNQYDASAAVMAVVKKGGGMWTYMNGKYFPSRGRTKQMEAALIKAGLIGVTTMKAKRIVLMTKDELARHERNL